MALRLLSSWLIVPFTGESNWTSYMIKFNFFAMAN